MLKYLLFLCCLQLSAQDDFAVVSAAQSLNNALILKDASKLSQLLHNDLTYGHSNGWVENKQEVLDNLKSGYLAYQNINTDTMNCYFTRKYAVIRFEAIHDVVLQSKAISLKLHVCQVWIKSGKQWKLLARQSTKLY